MVLLDRLVGSQSQILRQTEFQVLLLANVAPPLGNALISPLLSQLTGPFGVSEAYIGLMITAFTAPSVIAIPLVASATDQYGRKPILVAGLAGFGFAGTAIAVTTNFWVVLALRLLQGVAFAGTTPVIITSLGDIYDETTEATAQGLRFTGSGLVQAVFPALASVLVTIAWQYPFLLYAISVLIAGVVLLWFEEPTNVSRGETDHLGAADATEDVGEVENTNPDSGNDPSLSELIRNQQVAAILVGRTVPTFVFVSFLTYNSFVVTRLLDGTPSQAGLVITVNSVVYALAATQAGRVSELFDSQLSPLAGAVFLLGAGLAGMALAPSVPVAGLAVIAIGTGLGTALSLYRSVVTRLATVEVRGGLVGISESAGRLGASTAPVVLGLIVATLESTMSFEAAVRWTLIATGLTGAIVGIACLVVAARSPAVSE